MGHYYDCRHCGVEDHNHTCPGKEAEEKLARANYAEYAKKIRKLNLNNRKNETRQGRRALDLGY